MARLAVFAYASLVAVESTAQALGRPVPPPPPARLRGWRRRWSQARDNHRSEKTFALADGSLPPYILGLNLERGEDGAGPVNGALIEVTEAELDRLDLREGRYDRVDVIGEVELPGGEDPPDLVVAYSAKPEHFAAEPPPGAVILSTYAAATELGFRMLGPGELDLFHATTGPYPVGLAEATLISGKVRPGNPRAW
jgi:hypothetical protein